MPAKFPRSRGPLVADQQRHRSLGDPRPPDASDGEHPPGRTRIEAPDEAQLALRDREDFRRAPPGGGPPTSGESHADVSPGSKLAASANTTPRISPPDQPMKPA